MCILNFILKISYESPLSFFLKAIVVTPSFSNPTAAIKSFFPPQYPSTRGVDLFENILINILIIKTCLY